MQIEKVQNGYLITLDDGTVQVEVDPTRVMGLIEGTVVAPLVATVPAVPTVQPPTTPPVVPAPEAAR